MRRILLFGLAVARRFYTDQCLQRAAALAYASILAIVPLFAVMFSVLKGLGVQRRLEPLLLSRLSLSADTTEAIIGYIDRTNVTTLGTLGAAMLLVTVVSTLGSIENSFNQIWRVRQGRTAWRKVTDYLSVVLLTPFLLLAAVALTSSLHVRQVLTWLEQNQQIGATVMQGLRYFPVLVNALAIGVLYGIMPNRRQSPGAVALGAVLAGAAWQVVQWTYVTLQIGVAHYNAIYGALSQLPVTLAWLYVSWAVILGGAEIAAVYELGVEAAESDVGAVSRAAIALEVLVRAARAFTNAGPGVDPLVVARALRVAPETAAGITEALAHRGWLAVVEEPRRHYVLARDPGAIELGALAEPVSRAVPAPCAPEVHAVLRAVEAAGHDAWAQWRLADVLAQGTHPAE